ncbi:hypothetical protein CLV80_108143 [Yoonia maritima]|uniref:Lipid/polyisoprenoid-binding YceI-like domain-containing protein n=1 Tax=Yoonia maritima TaxID=1435347 RepID=A0A2T0VXJ4_9RHOB|nr:hypothetical protein [Yoonia maritima]PRY76679.1 hypothetical protein CLV80_108143 [Yoonia maritima]
MEPKTKRLFAYASAAIIVLSTAPNLLQAEQHQNVTLSGNVQTIKLRGAGTALQLHTTQPGTNQINVTAEDNIGCSFATRVSQEGDVLLIEVVKEGFRFGPWCDPDLAIAMPAGLGLDIGLENLAANIQGAFGDITIRSENSVIQFDGRADHFAMTGRKAALDLNFAAEMSRDDVQINVDVVLSDIDFSGA